MNENSFTIAGQYQFYLEKVELKESDMLPVQRVQTKQAFVAGMSQAFVLMTEKLPQMPETEGFLALKSLQTDLQNFWQNETK